MRLSRVCKFKYKVRIFLKKCYKLIKKCVSFLLNPRFLICFLAGWIITNGWCYIFVALGAYFGINWMLAVGTAYMSFLWTPFTPEKILTLIIAIFLLKLLFPKDEKTLKVLENELIKEKNLYKTLAKNGVKTEKKESEKSFRRILYDFGS